MIRNQRVNDESGLPADSEKNIIPLNRDLPGESLNAFLQKTQKLPVGRFEMAFGKLLTHQDIGWKRQFFGQIIQRKKFCFAGV